MIKLALVVLDDGAHVTADALKQHVREALAGLKVPHGISILDQLPRGNAGKMLRRELQSRTAVSGMAIGARREPVRSGGAATEIE